MIPITDQLSDLFPHVMVVNRLIGEDRYGNQQFATEEEEVKCRISGRTQMVLDRDGQEKVSNLHAVCATYYNLTADDQFTLPLEFTADPRNPDNLEARRPKAMSVDKASDENGPHHEVIYFANARVRL